MPVSVNTGSKPEPVRLKAVGPTSKSDLENAFTSLQIHAREGRVLLVDFRAALFSITTAEFMSVIDHWFSVIGSQTRAALLFCPEGQKDQAMLFDTKSFLLGGVLKTFKECADARQWLADGRAE
jgi:Ni/Fe-hydrogenase subunit HybB-like protein